MPKQAYNVSSGPPKKRGRKKIFGRRVSHGKEPKPRSMETTDTDLDSITAQTATNLKAFRFLFGTHEEETEEEFIGYSRKEALSIKTTFRWRCRKMKAEIANFKLLKCDAQGSTTTSETIAPLLSLPKDTTSLPLSPVKSPTEVKLNEVTGTADRVPSSSDLKFIGYPDSDPLKAACQAKSQKIFQCCQDARQMEEVGKKLCSSSISSVEPQTNTLNVNGVINPAKGISKRKAELTVASGGRGRKSKSPRNAPTMNLKDFVQAQSMTEITVTPILQTDISKAKVVSMLASPFRTTCLPKM